MVTEVFDARQIPEADRLDVTRATVAQRYAPLEMEFAADLGPMAAHFSLTELGDLVLCSSVSTAVKLHRTAELARDDLTPSVFLALQMTGSSVVVQRGREVVLRPGELVVYDSTMPFVLADTAGMRMHKFRFPLDRMGLPADVFRVLLPPRIASSIVRTRRWRSGQRTQHRATPSGDHHPSRRRRAG
jgi:hypothetical protein